ncbi:MAG: hypothetical protein A2Y88_10345 [Chloroflexi bacterium RBG_13_48_10]|nr:MAG: hypothetical protein A2Y88_10345 [Chloroflexi bacterium RBG_13_48_10]
MENQVHWSPGDIIVMRGILKGKLWWACPAYVVQDTEELIALYWPAGTPTRSPIKRPTVQDEIENHIELEERKWTDNDVLSLSLKGAAWAIELMWKAGTRQFNCWYVHLQEPRRRTKIGFDTMDQMLDIVISPDRKQWRWKDEDEFNEAGTTGLYSPGKIRSIRLEGERVIAMLNANAAPFCDGWENWQAPLEWTIPTFPAGWEIVPLL